MPHKKQKKDKKKKKNSLQPKEEEKETVTIETNIIENSPPQPTNSAEATPT